jgi:hypothetical protein
MDVLVTDNPAGEVQRTSVVDTNCELTGPMVPNEHTAALSINGILVPFKEIRVPPPSPLDVGETLEATGALCRVIA